MSDNPTPTVDERVQTYIQVRNQLKKMKEHYEKEIAPFVDLQNLLTGWLQEFLQQTKVDSAKTKHGTVYSSTKFTASLADPEAFMKFVKEHDMFELMDQKANANAVKDYVAEHKNLPPGVNLSAVRTIGVRSPKANGSD